MAPARRLRDGRTRASTNGYGLWPAEVPPGWTEWYGLVDHTTYRMWGYDVRERPHARVRQAAGRNGPQVPDRRARRGRRLTSSRARLASPSRSSRRWWPSSPPPRVRYVQRLTGQPLVRGAPASRPLPRNAACAGPRSYNERDLSDKPWFIARWNHRADPRATPRSRRACGSAGSRSSPWTRPWPRSSTACGRSGELDNTYVIFTSDNGYMQGEHRIPLGKMSLRPLDPGPAAHPRPPAPEDARRKRSWATSTWRPTVLNATPGPVAAAARRPLDPAVRP